VWGDYDEPKRVFVEECYSLEGSDFQLMCISEEKYENFRKDVSK